MRTMKSYRVHFDILKGKRYHGAYVDVFAFNKKDACDQVLTKYYNEMNNRNNRFYPFHREAEKISPDEMCKRIVMI